MVLDLLLPNGSERRHAARASAHEWVRHAPELLAALLHTVEAAQELAHLVELGQQLVDFMDSGAAARGDPPPPAAVDDRRVPPLLARHRLDDRLHADEVTLVDLRLL